MILSDFVSAGLNAYGISQQRAIANQNLQAQRENLDYQKELQNTIFAREDSAVQRRARDLEAAGLSKTLAAGSAASSGQAISTSAPQMDSGYARGYQNLRLNLDLIGSLTDMIEKVNAAKQSTYATSVAKNNAAINQRDYDILTGLSGNVLSKYAGDPLHQVYSALIDFFSKNKDDGSGSNGSTDSPFEQVVSASTDFIRNNVRQALKVPYTPAGYQESFPVEIDPLGYLDDALAEVSENIAGLLDKFKLIKFPSRDYPLVKSAGGSGYNYKSVYVK